MLGHCGSDRLEKTSKNHNLNLNGEFKSCEHYSVAKTRQNNGNKDWKVEFKSLGERL
jgi:hypothetical protein